MKFDWAQAGCRPGITVHISRPRDIKYLRVRIEQGEMIDAEFLRPDTAIRPATVFMVLTLSALEIIVYSY